MKSIPDGSVLNGHIWVGGRAITFAQPLFNKKPDDVLREYLVEQRGYLARQTAICDMVDAYLIKNRNQ